MRALAALGAISLLGIAVPAGAAGPAATGRPVLYGTAMKGPLTPVCRISVPCSGPAAYARVTFTGPHGITRTVGADAYGNYWVALRPGRYRVTSTIGMGVVDPGTVQARRGARLTRVDLMLDTGIR